MPADRPCVMSNMFVTIWNSAIASRLNAGWPKPEPATFCVICWPSRFSCKRSSSLDAELLPTSLAVTPLTSIDSSIQLRPCSGSCSICRRSTLPATCDERESTSGVSPMTVSVFADRGDLHRERDRRVLADEQLDGRHDDAPKPESSACTLYLPAASFGSRYSPRASVTPALAAPVSRFVAVTVTPGSTALVSSVDGADEAGVLREELAPRRARRSRTHRAAIGHACVHRLFARVSMSARCRGTASIRTNRCARGLQEIFRDLRRRAIRGLYELWRNCDDREESPRSGRIDQTCQV